MRQPQAKRPPVILHRRAESKPADPPISLFARLHRQLATPEGAERAMTTLGRRFTNAYRRESISGAGQLRAQLGEAKQMVLDKQYISLCAAYCATATPEQLHGLYSWAQLPFDPLWLEWPNPQVPEYMRRALPVDFADRPEDEVHDRKGTSASGTGVLLHYIPQRAAVHCLMAFCVPDDPLTVILPPRAFYFKPGFPEWSDDDLRTGVPGRLEKMLGDYANVMARLRASGAPGATEAELLGDALSGFLLAGLDAPDESKLPWSLRKPDQGWMAPLRRRVMPAGAHSGSDALGEMYTYLVQEKPADHDPHTQALMAEQITHACRLLHAVLPLVPVALGMLSLAPIRHVTDRIPAPIHPSRPNDWRWRHAHETVTLTRPLTVAEVVVHVIQPSGPSRASPMMHEVMGFWRVRSGVPSCNHVWHEEKRAEGTDTELGRPHRTAMLRYRCTKCQGLRSWVTSHHRGDPARGVKSKDYIIEGDA